MIDFIKNGSDLGQRYGKQAQGTGRMPGYAGTLDNGAINDLVKQVGGRSIMWGDHVIPPECGTTVQPSRSAP